MDEVIKARLEETLKLRVGKEGWDKNTSQRMATGFQL